MKASPVVPFIAVGGCEGGQAFPKVLLAVGDVVHRFGGRLEQVRGVAGLRRCAAAAATCSHKSPVAVSSVPIPARRRSPVAAAASARNRPYM